MTENERLPSQYEQEAVSSEPMYPIADQSFLKARIETTKHLAELKQSLRGYVMDENNEWKKVGSPLMNDEGANVMTSVLLHWINTPSLFADFTSDQINKKMIAFSFALQEELVSHESEWDIKGIRLVHESIEHFVHSALTRALNRGEAKSIGMLTTIQRTTYKPEEKKSRLNPFAR